MSNSILEGLIKEKDYSFKKLLFKVIHDNNLNLEEVLLLLYFINQEVPFFDIKAAQEVLFIDENKALESFASLTEKKLISLDMQNDNGKIIEVINLDNVYKSMVSDINKTAEETIQNDIFSTFEKEFGRTLSPSEYETINSWQKSGLKEEMIIGALKEASYNGVSNLRYIDKIIFEWGKKGFKSMDDVKKHLEEKPVTSDVLFDYNWLDDED